MAQAIKKIKVGDETHPIDGAFYLGTLSTVAGSGSSGSYKSVRWYVSDCEGVTAPYDGMRIAIKIPLAGVGTAGVILSINGNTDADYHPLAYNVNTVLTTHFPVNSIKVFVYDASATMTCYKASNTAVSVTGVWKADSNYDSNTVVTYGTLEYYFRPYVATEALYRYKFVMLDKDNRLVPLTTTNVANGTAVTNQTPTAKAFKPDKIWWYATTTTINASSVVGAQTLWRSGYNANNGTSGGMAICNFNSTISAYRLIYLCGTFDKATGLFSLRGGGTASSTQYYTQVPTNTANITLSSYFTSGYDYILLGGTYSSNTYIQLFDNNPMFHFDGTNLVPYDTWNTAQASSNQKVQGNGTGFGADATVNIVGGGATTVTADTTNNKITINTPAVTDTNQKVKTSNVTFGNDDVVEIKAGNNVTVTGDATAKTITIAATAQAATGYAGTLEIKSSTYYNGSQTLTSLTAGNVTTATLNASNIYVNNNIEFQSYTGLAYNYGSNVLYVGNLGEWYGISTAYYPNVLSLRGYSVYIEAQEASGGVYIEAPNVGGSVLISGYDSVSLWAYFDVNITPYDGNLNIYGTTNHHGNAIYDTGSIYPSGNGSYDLGGGTNKFNRLYASYVGTNTYPIQSVYASHLSISGNGETYLSNSYISIFASSYNTSDTSGHLYPYTGIILSANAISARISLYAQSSIYITANAGTSNIHLGNTYYGVAYYNNGTQYYTSFYNKGIYMDETGAIKSCNTNCIAVATTLYANNQILIGSSTYATTGGNVATSTNSTWNTYTTTMYANFRFTRMSSTKGILETTITNNAAPGGDVWYRFNLAYLISVFNAQTKSILGNHELLSYPTTAASWSSSYIGVAVTGKRATAYGTGDTYTCYCSSHKSVTTSTAFSGYGWFAYFCNDNNNGGDRYGWTATITMPVYCKSDV